jgi:hypothetical protein
MSAQRASQCTCDAYPWRGSTSGLTPADAATIMETAVAAAASVPSSKNWRRFGTGPTFAKPHKLQ